MRVMDLGPLPEDFGPLWTAQEPGPDGGPMVTRSIHPAGQNLLAYALWPEDEALRTAWHAANGAQGMAILEEINARHRIEDPVLDDLHKRTFPQVRAETQARIFDPHDGGFAPVSRHGGIEEALIRLSAAAPRLYGAGMILSTVRILHTGHQDELRGGASIGKAIDFLEEKGLQNRDWLRKAWASHKAVAHLGAAITVLSTIFPEDTLDTDQPWFGHYPLYFTVDVLLLARFFQEFGLAFFPGHGARAPLLDPATLWRVPEAVVHLPDLLEPGRLDEQDLERVRRRTAPRRY